MRWDAAITKDMMTGISALACAHQGLGTKSISLSLSGGQLSLYSVIVLPTMKYFFISEGTYTADTNDYDIDLSFSMCLSKFGDKNIKIPTTHTQSFLMPSWKQLLLKTLWQRYKLHHVPTHVSI